MDMELESQDIDDPINFPSLVDTNDAGKVEPVAVALAASSQEKKDASTERGLKRPRSPLRGSHDPLFHIIYFF